jgi:hypothetical protein
VDRRRDVWHYECVGVAPYTVERYAPGDVLEIAKCRRCGARREQRYYTDERGVDHKAHPRYLPGVGNSSDV